MIEPTRTDSHVSEDLSRIAFKEACLGLGWVVVDLSPDYGEDALVFVYEDQHATGEVFFVQLKAVSSQKRVTTNHIKLTLHTATLRRWSKLPLPVVLVAHLVDSRASYWLEMSDYLRNNRPDIDTCEHKTITVRVPVENKVQQSNLDALRAAISRELRGTALEITSLRDTVNRVESTLIELSSWVEDILGAQKRFHLRAGTMPDDLTGFHLPNLLYGHNGHPLVIRQARDSSNSYKHMGSLRFEVVRASAHDPQYRNALEWFDKEFKQIRHDAVLVALSQLQECMETLRHFCVVVVGKFGSTQGQALVERLVALLEVLSSITNQRQAIAEGELRYLSIAYRLRVALANVRQRIEEIKWVALELVLDS